MHKFRAATSHFFFFMWNENLDRIGKKLLLTKAALLHSIFLSVIGLWVKTWHRNKTACFNWILCKGAGLNWLPVWGKGVCSDLNRTAQLLQMIARKSFETMSGVILSWTQPKFAAKSIANEILCLKAIHDVVTSIDRTSFNFWFEYFFEQSVFVNNHLLWYWPMTNHP